MRRTIAIIMTVVMLLSLSLCAFAENEEAAQYTLHMDRNGKTLLDADGKAVSGDIKDKAVAEFYRLMNGVPVNWVNFNYNEFEVIVDAAGNVTLGKQTLSLLDGTFLTSSNAEAALYESPEKYHAAGDGETTFALIGYDGSEVASAAASTEMDANGRLIPNCPCPNCGENQTETLHAMICGHYDCEEGAEGHGAGACGTPGHMNCDGREHGKCANCQEPLCSGKHGTGVCQHVHQWLTGPGWALCETCGEARYYEIPPITLIP